MIMAAFVIGWLVGWLGAPTCAASSYATPACAGLSQRLCVFVCVCVMFCLSRRFCVVLSFIVLGL